MKALDRVTPTDDAPDSRTVPPAMTGASNTRCDDLVEQAAALSIVVGRWQCIEPPVGSAIGPVTVLERGQHPELRPRDPADDAGGKRRLAREGPDEVAELAARLKQVRERGKPR
jgi:hypothetical protein